MEYEVDDNISIDLDNSIHGRGGYLILSLSENAARYILRAKQ
jgi:predicted RNA-binding protein YlxR (DUF448 family)